MKWSIIAWMLLGWAVSAAPAAAQKTPNPPLPAAANERPKVEGHWGEDAVGFRWVEDDSRDNRWNAMDTGPFMTSALQTPTGMVPKALSVRVGDRQQAAVCYDLEQGSLRCGWTGNFLAYNPARFGIISPPAIAGPPRFTAPAGNGWPGARWKYRGLYLHGRRVVLAYAVDGVDVLDSPWLEGSGKQTVFTRSFEIGPAGKPLHVLVASPGTLVLVHGDSGHARLIRREDAAIQLEIAPHAEPIRVKLLFPVGGDGRSEREGVESARQDGSAEDAEPRKSPRPLREIPPAEELSRWTRPGPRLWEAALTTRGSLGRAATAYVVDTIALPFENPYRALLFAGGHDFFSRPGRAALCTLHGDVWLIEGLDADLDVIRWRRFATGLFQPLGLRILNDQVYVLGRDQVTRLHDTNGDGHADFYESFNNQADTSPGGHDFSACLETDSQGNFFYVSQQGVHRIAADGSRYETMATGLRNPNGLGIGPGDLLTAAPQEGNWTPASAVFEVTEGGYYGYAGPRESEHRPLGYDPPICWIPRRVDNSTGGQVWVTSDRWGPLQGQLLNLSFGQCRLLLTLTEPRGFDLPDHWPVLGECHHVPDPSTLHPPAARILQGGTFELPLVFESGVMRGRFSPHDGQLYVSGLRGWVSAAVQDGCLQRVRYTGRKAYLPTRVRTLNNGIALTFSEPLDPLTAEDPGSYDVQQWNYRYSGEYGSAEYRVTHPGEQGRDAVDVRSATLLDDQTVFLELGEVRPVMQMAVQFALNSRDGHSVRGHYYHTIHAVPDVKLDPARLTRRPRAAGEQLSRDKLAPGLRWEWTREGAESDARVSRLAALSVPAGAPPTALLASGSFQAQASGYLHVPLRGSYAFQVEGRGEVRLRINDREVLAGRADDLRSLFRRTVTLHKGFNRLEMLYLSPAAGDATLRLLWSGETFAGEPIPPTVLFHDPHGTSLPVPDALRRGRALFASLRCHRCHVPSGGAPANAGEATSRSLAMPELEYDAPELDDAGDRLRPGWIARWLLQPDVVREAGEMPHFFDAADPAHRQDAVDLAAYLVSPRARNGDPSNAPPSDAEEGGKRQEKPGGELGERLFEQLGCLACHHLDAPRTSPQPRLSLAQVGTKFRPGALRRFLLAPHADYRHSRMPDFALSPGEAAALEAFLLEEQLPPRGAMEDMPPGDAERGRAKFARLGCAACHGRPGIEVNAGAAAGSLDGEANDARNSAPAWERLIGDTREPTPGGCIAASTPSGHAGPRYELSRADREALATFLAHGDASLLERHDPAESAGRVMERLRCAACHDRDGKRSPRRLILAEEGSGRVPDLLPDLTWTGEKLQAAWIKQFLRGEVNRPVRPWLQARMPRFPAVAETLAAGLARRHGLTADPIPPPPYDPEATEIGRRLASRDGLDCRQCHGVGKLLPRGDEQTQIALGINFADVRERLRPEYYHRFLRDPVRWDPSTKMPRLSADGVTTKVRSIYDGDAGRQFEALWHYIHHFDRLPPSVPQPE